MNRKVLVTWSSGFIGFHLSKKLLELGYKVVGFDNENSYYDPKIKEQRRKILMSYPNFSFFYGNLSNISDIDDCFRKFSGIYKICHLAAQAWVRSSMNMPYNYLQINIFGFLNLIEVSKKFGVQHIVYASSSSVYGEQGDKILHEKLVTDTPLSIYAMTKKSNELLASIYAEEGKFSFVGLRFFSVYGPMWRPDMMYSKCIESLCNNIPLKIYGDWNSLRDWTYVDDIIDGIVKSLNYQWSKHEIFNLWSWKPITLKKMLDLIEKITQKKIIKVYQDKNHYDVSSTFADYAKAQKYLNWKPEVDFKEGITRILAEYTALLNNI